MNRRERLTFWTVHSLDVATFALVLTLFPAVIAAEQMGKTVELVRTFGVVGYAIIRLGLILAFLVALQSLKPAGEHLTRKQRILRIAINVGIVLGLVGAISNLVALFQLWEYYL